MNIVIVTTLLPLWLEAHTPSVRNSQVGLMCLVERRGGTTGGVVAWAAAPAAV